MMIILFKQLLIKVKGMNSLRFLIVTLVVTQI